MEMVTFTIEVDSKLLEEAEKVFAENGLTVEEACILFFKETIKRGAIPFEYSAEDIKAVKEGDY